MCALLCGLLLSSSLVTALEPPPTTKEELTFYTGFEAPMLQIYNQRVAEIFGRLGIKAKVLWQPAQRALQMANTTGDGAAGRVRHLKQLAPANTQNLLLVDEPLADIDIVVYTQKGLTFAVNGWESLRPYRNGARRGAKILEKNVPTDQARSIVASNEQLFSMLASGRIDTVVEWRPTGDEMIRQLGLKNIRALPTPLLTLPFYLYVNKRHEALIPQLIEALKASKQDGSYQRIYDQNTTQPQAIR